MTGRRGPGFGKRLDRAQTQRRRLPHQHAACLRRANQPGHTIFRWSHAERGNQRQLHVDVLFVVERFDDPRDRTRVLR